MHTNEPPREGPTPTGSPGEAREFEPLRAPGLADFDTTEPLVARSTPGTRQGARGRRVAFVVALLVAGLALAALLVEFRMRRVRLQRELAQAPAPAARPRPAQVATPPREASPPAPAPAPPRLREVRRAAEGVPAVLTLSSVDHGLDVSRAGLPLQRGAATAWTVATAPSPHKVFPPYAALFVAELGPLGELLDLGLVTKRPRPLRGDGARVFLAQPSHRPDSGSFDLVVRRVPAPRDAKAAEERHAQVYVDAVTPLDERPFVVSGLAPRQAYTVRLRANPDGPTPPVLMVATRPSSAQHLQAPRYDEPLDQRLLAPGQATSVTAATALTFVVPMVPGAPERWATVEVFKPGAPPEVATKELESPANWYTVGQGHLARGDAVGAREAFLRCLTLAPTHEGCALGMSRVATLQQ